jgi:hypothetical protein
MSPGEQASKALLANPRAIAGLAGPVAAGRNYPTMTTTLPLACPSPRYRSASGTSPNR